MVSTLNAESANAAADFCSADGTDFASSADVDFAMFVDQSDFMYAVPAAGKIPSKKQKAKKYIKKRMGAKAVKAFERSSNMEGSLDRDDATPPSYG